MAAPEFRKLSPAEVAALKRPKLVLQNVKMILKVTHLDADRTLLTLGDNSVKEVFRKSKAMVTEDGKYEREECHEEIAPWEKLITHRMVEHHEKRFLRRRPENLLRRWKTTPRTSLTGPMRRTAICATCKTNRGHRLSSSLPSYSTIVSTA